ncbi:DNA cytosine methyltransferase [Thermococcus sp. 2319x1]|uniref:DNA cytosine methyltransferase n=1 Tax=Thermococcus sp. 2319x1 TaxID=1674923 RepID=UPI001582F8A9|nr:DNA cytosine methyltransferase [Thermococcus sp. 2319x1]
MRKVAILIVGLLVLSVVPLVKSAVPSTAQVTPIKLGLGDSVIFGNYEIKFADVNPSWTKVNIHIYEKGKTTPSDTPVLRSEESYPFPTENNPLFYVKIVWIKSDAKTIYLRIESPLKKLESKTLSEGETYQLPPWLPEIKIKVVEANDTSAKFEIILPYKTITPTIKEGNGYGVPYKLTEISGETISYDPYLYIYLNSSTNNGDVNFDIYIPKYATTSLQVKRAQVSEETPQQVVAEPTELIYNDILYVGEILTFSINRTTYKLRLDSVEYYYSVGYCYLNFSVFDENNISETFTVKEGSRYQLSQVPIRVEIPSNSVDLSYNRTKVRLYAPEGSKVQPIVREANIKVEVSVSTTSILLDGDELIVFVNVENQGRGKAFDVNVVAPIPSGFELRSGIGTWSLKMLDAFTKVPVLVYTLKPTQVGSYKLDTVNVRYYNETKKENVVKSNTINQIIVYGLPKLSLSGEAFNGTWSSYVHTQEKTVKLKFTVSAEGKDAKYEFIRNATIKLLLPDSLDGETELFIGDLKAGETKTLESEYAILKPDNAIISAMLVYQDPLGKWHEENFGNLVIVNSLPPAVEIKEVKVYPSPEELPQYVNSTLANLDNKTREALAEKLNNITISYLPPSEKGINWWPILTVLFLVASALLAYGYIDLKSKYEKALKELGRRKRRPGGLPKKEETLKVEEKAGEETQT